MSPTSHSIGSCASKSLCLTTLHIQIASYHYCYIVLVSVRIPCRLISNQCEPVFSADPCVQALEAGGRTLLDDEVDERPYIVVTAEGLLEALLKGRRNIEISAHLDLTTLPLLRNTGCEDGCDSPLPPITTLTKSIRVRAAFSTSHTPDITHHRDRTIQLHLSIVPIYSPCHL